MKKIFTLLTLCLCMSATAWADFTDGWTGTADDGNNSSATTGPWSTTAETFYPSGLTIASGNTVHMALRCVNAASDFATVTITFTYSKGAHRLDIKGVDLVKADGTVVASDYHNGSTGNSHTANIYTLSNVRAGNYVLRYYVGHNTNGNDLTKTRGNITVTNLTRTETETPEAFFTAYKMLLYSYVLVGSYYTTEFATAISTYVNSPSDDNLTAITTAQGNLASTGTRTKLENGQIFQIKCTDATNNRGYIAYYADGNNEENVSLAGAVFSGQTYPAIDAANVYSGWSVYYYDSKYYLYNAHNGKFVKVVGGIVKYTENLTEAATIVLSNTSGSVTEWNLKIYGTSNYLSASVSRGNASGAVRTDTNNNDAGAKFNLIKVTDGSGNISTVADDTRNAIARTILLPVLSAKTPKLGSSTGQYTYTGSNEATDVANINTARNYIDGTVTPTEGQLEAAITNMTGITSSLTLNQPTAGKLYRFKGKATSRYMKSNGANAQMTLSDADTGADNGPKTIFMVTADKKLLSYDLGLYVNETRAIGNTVANSNTFEFLESEGGYVGYYTIKSNYSSPYLWGGTSGSGDNIVYKTDRNGTYAAGNCDWEIEEVTWLPVPVYADPDDYKLGTFYSPVALRKDESRIKFYTGTVTNNYFNLTEYTGDVIPANKAFVTEYVEGGQTSNNCAYLQITSDPTPTTKQQEQLDNNQLEGQLETINTPSPDGKIICTMQEIGGALTFARYTGTTVKGFRAYLPVDGSTAGGGSGSFRLVFGVPTGIDTIGNQPAQEQTVYDLSGRRVEHAGKGLYIVNGKKVMIK